jgi:DNA-binding transcriptional MerR regulator
MDKRKKQRISTLNAINGLMNMEITGLKMQQRKEDELLGDLKQKQAEIEREIDAAESQVRTAIDPDAQLILEEYRMLLAYLDHKQGMSVNNLRKQGFTIERIKKIEKKMVHQGLKIRGIENLLQRRHKDLQLDIENKLLSHLDDAWLQRERGDE